jgi:hypothetical protein
VVTALHQLERRHVKYQVTFEGLAAPVRKEGQPLDADKLEAHLDRVMGELVRLRAEDATVAGTIAWGEVETSVVVEAPDLESALERGQAIVRTAIEEGGGPAPEWLFDWRAVKAARAESLARATG